MKIINEWRNRDWAWVVGILTGIIIIILTWRLNDKDSVVNIISMFASGASIILAAVAIIQSTIYNSSSNELNVKMTEKLSILENNIEVVKENILKNASDIIENAPIADDIKEDMKNDLVKNIIDDEYFKQNHVASAYMIEKIIYDKCKSIYSENYKIKVPEEDKYAGDYGYDIVLENELKKVFIVIKVWTRPMNAKIEEVLAKLNQTIINKSYKEEKTIIPVLIIISNNINPGLRYHISKHKCDNKIILLSHDEILNISDDKFKEKLDI